MKIDRRFLNVPRIALICADKKFSFCESLRYLRAIIFKWNHYQKQYWLTNKTFTFTLFIRDGTNFF